MKEREFLRNLRSLGLAVMTTPDLAKLARTSGQGLNTFLYRLEKRGVLARLERGKYYIPDTPPEALASSIVSPSYISFLYALSLHHLTAQIPREIAVASRRSRRGIRLAGHRIRFVRLGRDRFFGMERARAAGQYIVTVATPEKAILDCLAYPAHCPVAEAAGAVSAAMGEKLLDTKKLAEMARRFGSRVAAKRLGYIADVSGVDLFRGLGMLVNSRYDPLNPHLPPEGARNAKWRLIMNEEV
ncbi:MAG: hypothetical protein FJ149_09140 [Euryarchaeota archaeon]|nr:hypothetical protein [Euryarchaeota archaeon]